MTKATESSLQALCEGAVCYVCIVMCRVVSEGAGGPLWRNDDPTGVHRVSLRCG